MTFTSFEFVFFFILIAMIRRRLPGLGAQNLLLLLASLLFYLSWSVPCLFLILFTALADYSIARKLDGTTDPSARRYLLMTSLVMNLGFLGFFKYAHFFLENASTVLNALGWRVGVLQYEIVLPPAISFYTFASMSYMLDVYYERIPACRSARDYTLFVTFFPKLLSGPIARARELLPQFQTGMRAAAEDVEIGLNYFMLGAVKKLVIADQLAPHVNLVFSAPAQYDGLTLLIGALAYTLQIYCDFSGYSDMAIGCARLLGFRFPENFQMPFSARNITEFWRRWHITLSQWFRDYLFLPLEMATRSNPHPLLRVSVNMTITMLLCGLWHGPSWNFVIWGGIHGVALAVHRVWSSSQPLARWENRPAFRLGSTACAHLLTLTVVVLAMVFFRAQSFADAMTYLGRLLSWAGTGTRLLSPSILAAVFGVFLVHLLVHKDRNLAVELPRMSLPPQVAGHAGLLFLLVVFGVTNSSAFIYFQF